VNSKTTESRAPSPVNRNGRMTYTETRGNPDPRPATAPYYEVTDGDARAAQDAVSRDEIPRAYQEEVRRYFESVQTQPARAGGQPAPPAK